MQVSKSALWCALIFVVCALPGVLTRDLSSVNELNYVVIASEALARGDFFCFNEASYAFPNLPPLYFWLCMLGVLIEGGQAAVFLLALNVTAFAIMMLALDATYGRSLLKSGRGIAAAALLTIPALVGAAFIAQPAMLNCALCVSLIALLSQRCEEALAGEDHLPYRAVIVVLISLLMLLSTPFALLPPLLTTAVALLIKRRLGVFFRVFPAWWFGILLAVLLLWAGCVWLNGGAGYAKALFLGAPLGYFKGEIGHPQSGWYLTAVAAAMGMPLVFAACYAGFREIVHDKSAVAASFLFALIPLPLMAALLCLPESKTELMLLPALPGLSYVILYYLQQVRQRDRLMKVLLVAGMAPCGITVLLAYFSNDSLPVLNGTYVICAVLFIALFTVLSVIRTAFVGISGGLSAFAAGIMVMIVTLGFAVPKINPYVSPIPAVEKTLGLSQESGIADLCVIGIAKPWTLNIAGSGLKIRVPDLEGFMGAECAASYRLIGRSALRQYDALKALRESEGAFLIGDSVLLEPSGHAAAKWYWRAVP